MEDFYQKMTGKNCFTFLPYDERIACHYTKIGEEISNSVVEEDFNGLQTIGDVFARMFKDARIITVEEYLGFPKFNLCEQLTKKQLKEEISRIEELLMANRIRVAQKRTYPEDEFYHFLTVDLMAQEMYDIRMGDMYCTFVYELIKPDIRNDIAGIIEEFLSMLLMLDWRFMNFCATADLMVEGILFSENRRGLHEKIRKAHEGWLPYEMDLMFAWEGEHQKEIEVKADFNMKFQNTELFKPHPGVHFILVKEGKRWKVKSMTGLLAVH